MNDFAHKSGWGRSRLGRLVRWGLLAGVALVATGAGASWLLSVMVGWTTRGRIFTKVEEVPQAGTALVLGTSPLTAGGNFANPYFVGRMEAAAALYHAGKVQRLLVSGDNREVNYNEPAAMTAALVARGVPAEAIIPDYAGFRTLDSILRAEGLAGGKDLVIVSQRFHCERALVIARHYGYDATAFTAPDVSSRYGWKTEVREVFARWKLVLDLYVLRTRPHFEA